MKKEKKGIIHITPSQFNSDAPAFKNKNKNKKEQASL